MFFARRALAEPATWRYGMGLIFYQKGKIMRLRIDVQGVSRMRAGLAGALLVHALAGYAATIQIVRGTRPSLWRRFRRPRASHPGSPRLIPDRGEQRANDR